MDVLAVAAAAATTEVPLLACTTAGVTVSAVQARAVSALTRHPVIVALDGDPAGREGTTRWVDLLHRQLRHPVALADLQPGLDPADVLRAHGPAALLDLVARARPPAYELTQLSSPTHPPSRDL